MCRQPPGEPVCAPARPQPGRRALLPSRSSGPGLAHRQRRYGGRRCRSPDGHGVGHHSPGVDGPGPGRWERDEHRRAVHRPDRLGVRAASPRSDAERRAAPVLGQAEAEAVDEALHAPEPGRRLPAPGSVQARHRPERPQCQTAPQAHQVEQAETVSDQASGLDSPARPGPRPAAKPDPQLGVMTSPSTAADLVAEWPVWSTTARVVVRDPSMLAVARHAVESELAGMDRAASRFRPDSEVVRLAEAGGRPTRISPLLAATVRAALAAAVATDGAVDPTLGRSLVAAGYDADFPELSGRGQGRSVPVTTEVLASWQDVLLVGDLLTVPDGVLLDLGATGKALAVDRAAVRASIAAHGPVLVAVGGDLRVAGTLPDQPWVVELAERPDDAGVAWVHVSDGGVATSTTTARRWRSGDRWAHHVLDPATGRPADVHWRTATVAAATCVEANAASTAALVKGATAEPWLRASGLPARLVHRDGAVHVLGGWPEREAA